MFRLHRDERPLTTPPIEFVRQAAGCRTRPQLQALALKRDCVLDHEWHPADNFSELHKSD